MYFMVPWLLKPALRDFPGVDERAHPIAGLMIGFVVGVCAWSLGISGLGGISRPRANRWQILEIVGRSVDPAEPPYTVG